MFDVKRFQRAFDLSDTTRTGFVWRCLFKCIIILMGYKLNEIVLSSIFSDMDVPSLISMDQGIKILNKYRLATQSKVAFRNEKERDKQIRKLLPHGRNMERSVVMKNLYGNRTFLYSEFMIFVAMTRDLPNTSFNGIYLHSALDCDCEGDSYKERIYEEVFLDDGSSVV